MSVRAPAADHRAEVADLALDQLHAGRILEGPVVQALPVVPEPRLDPHVRSGDEAVEGHALVVDHASHTGYLPREAACRPNVRQPNRGPRTWAPASPRGARSRPNGSRPRRARQRGTSPRRPT